jgi:hypothetical protein
MRGMFAVNDFEKVKNCFRGELEIFVLVKPNTMTRIAKVKRNSLSVIACKCLSIHLLATTGAVHGIAHTLYNTQSVNQQLRFTLDVFEHPHDLSLFSIHPNCFTPRGFVIITKQMKDTVDE